MNVAKFKIQLKALIDELNESQQANVNSVEVSCKSYVRNDNRHVKVLSSIDINITFE